MLQYQLLLLLFKVLIRIESAEFFYICATVFFVNYLRNVILLAVGLVVMFMEVDSR